MRDFLLKASTFSKYSFLISAVLRLLVLGTHGFLKLHIVKRELDSYLEVARIDRCDNGVIILIVHRVLVEVGESDFNHLSCHNIC